MSNLTVSTPVDSFMGSANQVAMLAALANAGVFDYSTFTVKLPGTVQFATKTLTLSNNLTLAGDDGSTLNIGAGGTLGNAAFSGTSTGGNGNADLNKLLQYISGGVARANAFFAINNSAGGVESILASTGLQFTNNGQNSTLVPPAAMSGAWTWTLPDNGGTLLTSGDFGTMAAQDADAVDIANGSAVLSNLTTGNLVATGGTMDGVVIGFSSKEPGAFQYLIIGNSGSIILNPSAAGVLQVKQNSDGAIIEVVNVASQPSTPTGGFRFYSISGQPYTLDVNGVLINISLCPQPDTGWTANSDAGSKALAIASSMTRQSYQASLNVLAAGVGDDLYTIGEKLKALEAALSANPSLYPNA